MKMDIEVFQRWKPAPDVRSLPESLQEWGAVLDVVNHEVIDRSQTGVCALVFRPRTFIGAAVAMHTSPSFAGAPITQAVRGQFTRPYLEALFGSDRGWCFAMMYGRFTVMFGHTPDGPPSIRRCLLIRVNGSPAERALLVFADVPQSVDLEQCIETLQTTLTRPPLGASSR